MCMIMPKLTKAFGIFTIYNLFQTRRPRSCCLNLSASQSETLNSVSIYTLNILHTSINTRNQICRERSSDCSADVLDVEEESGVGRDDAGGGLPASAPGSSRAVGQLRRQPQRPLSTWTFNHISIQLHHFTLNWYKIEVNLIEYGEFISDFCHFSGFSSGRETHRRASAGSLRRPLCPGPILWSPEELSVNMQCGWSWYQRWV